MKVRLFFLGLSVTLMLSLIIFLVIKIINKKEVASLKPIYDITYIGDNNLACLTFYKDGSYQLFDCDSEPTNYFFDSENECKYKIEGSVMKFNCKYNFSNSKTKEIEITRWTKKEFQFKYENKIITFMAR